METGLVRKGGESQHESLWGHEDRGSFIRGDILHRCRQKERTGRGGRRKILGKWGSRLAQHPE